MYDFECHYREDRWQTARYFDFVKDFLLAAQNREASDDCEPPPCPTTPYTVTTEQYLKGESLLYVACFCKQIPTNPYTLQKLQIYREYLSSF